MSDEPPGRDPEGQRPTSLPSTVAGAADAAGRQIGPYRLLDRLGEGGMGEVWLAEQTAPVRRRVALKVIKQGMDTRQVVARFEAERQALALMDHPAIAKVHDAGITPRGRPYFVMEHVAGVPITDHCDSRKLTTRERLELFIKVCEGVQHAHQKAVIHRDLKPSNVLVSLVDGKPAPKIIDFGVAKATAQKLTDRTLHTQLGVMIGTPAYMSPEQAELTGQDIDTRTDVYALGAMLYELLVGTLPFDPRELQGAGLDAIVRKIRDDEPPRPSTRLSTLGEQSVQSAERRRTALPALRRELSGDLDWITMKALEKDRARRYGSPQELAEDIRRHLTNQPVVARPPSAGYRVRKFVRRHRAGVIAATVVLLALVAGAVVSAWQYVRAETARREAEYRAFTASLAAAAAAHERNDPRTVRRHLESIPAEQRGWEWSYLAHDSDRSLAVPLTLPRREGGYRMDLSPDGTLVAFRAGGGNREPILVHDARTGDKLDEIPLWESRAVAFSFSPDNRYLAYSGWGMPCAQIWELAGRRPVVPPEAVRQFARFLAFHPDGDRVAVFTLGSGVIELRGLRDWERRSAIVVPWNKVPLAGDFSPDGRWLAVGADAGDPVRVFDVDTGQIVRELGSRHGGAFPRFDPSGGLLALLTGNGPVEVYDTASWMLSATLPRGESWPGGVLFVEDGTTARLVTGGRDGILRFFDPRDPRALCLDRGAAEGDSSMAWDRDLDQIVTAHPSGVVRRWARQRSWDVHQTGANLALAFDGPSRLLYGMSGTLSDPDQVGVWSVSDGRQLARLRQYGITVAHTSQVTAMAASPDRRRLAVATASLWQQGRLKVYDLYSGLGIFDSRPFWGSDPRAIAWSADGERIVLGGDNGFARIYDARTFSKPIDLLGHRGSVAAATFVPDGSRVVTGGEDGTIRVWTTGGDELRSLSLPEGEEIGSMILIEAGRRAIAGTAGGAIYVVPLDGNGTVSRLDAHSARVSALALSPDGERLVSGSNDRTIVVWDARRRQPLLTLFADAAIRGVAFDPEGRRLAVADASGAVRLLDSVGEPERQSERDGIGDARRPAGAVVADLLARDADVARARERVQANASLTGTARDAAVDALDEAAEKVLSSAYDFERNQELARDFVRRQVLRDLLVTPSDQDQWPDYSDAAGAILALPDVPPAERQAAAEFARAMRYWHFAIPELRPNGAFTNELIMETVATSGRPDDEYVLALFAAESLHEALPDDPGFEMTLGCARYRARLYRAAAETLDPLVRARRADTVPPAEAWGFLALARARSGADAVAREAARACDAAVAAGRWSDEEQARALCAEARELLARPAAERVRDEVSRQSLNAVAVRLDVGNPNGLYEIRSLARRHSEHGRREQAERLFRKAVDRAVEMQGPNSVNVCWTEHELAEFLDAEGRHDEADALLMGALARARRVRGEDHPDVATCLSHLGRHRLAQGRLEEAEAAAREALEMDVRDLPKEHWHVAQDKSLLGGVLMREGRYDEAEPLLLEGYAAMQPPPTFARRKSEALQRIVDLYDAWGRPEDAKHWRETAALR